MPNPGDAVSNPDELDAQLSLLEHALLETETAVGLLAAALEDDNNEDTRITLAQGVYRLHGLKRVMDDVFRQSQKTLIDAMGEHPQPIHLSNGGTIETKGGYPRKKWDHASLGSVVAQRIVDSSIDLDTGEVTLGPEEMVREILRYAAPSYWRVAELDRLGVNANEYCEVGDAISSLIIRRNDDF